MDIRVEEEKWLSMEKREKWLSKESSKKISKEGE
jgi:hypothetical protein